MTTETRASRPPPAPLTVAAPAVAVVAPPPAVLPPAPGNPPVVGVGVGVTAPPCAALRTTKAAGPYAVVWFPAASSTRRATVCVPSLSARVSSGILTALSASGHGVRYSYSNGSALAGTASAQRPPLGSGVELATVVPSTSRKVR